MKKNKYDICMDCKYLRDYGFKDHGYIYHDYDCAKECDPNEDGECEDYEMVEEEISAADYNYYRFED